MRTRKTKTLDKTGKTEKIGKSNTCWKEAPYPFLFDCPLLNCQRMQWNGDDLMKWLKSMNEKWVKSKRSVTEKR